MPMHDDELAVDEAVVARLIAAQFPQWAGLPLAAVPWSGTDNALFRLGDQLVVRLPRIHWAVLHVEKEHRWLPRLAPLLPVRIPMPLALGEPGDGYPWHWGVYQWLDGENPRPGGLADASGLAQDVARFAAALHRVDAAEGPPAGDVNFTRGVPLAQRDDMTRAAVEQLAPMGEVDAGAVLAAWDTALHAPAWEGDGVWVHGDLSPGNVLVDGAGRLTGVIDFGGLGVGDPAVDLLPAWNLFDTRSRRVLRDALGADDATWERGRGWALSVALIALPYYRDRHAAIAAGSRRVIAEVLSKG